MPLHYEYEMDEPHWSEGCITCLEVDEEGQAYQYQYKDVPQVVTKPLPVSVTLTKLTTVFVTCCQVNNPATRELWCVENSQEQFSNNKCESSTDVFIERNREKDSEYSEAARLSEHENERNHQETENEKILVETAWIPGSVTEVAHADENTYMVDTLGDHIISCDVRTLYIYKLDDSDKLSMQFTLNWKEGFEKRIWSLACAETPTKGPVVYLSCQQSVNQTIHELYAMDINNTKSLRRIRTKKLNNGEALWAVGAYGSYITVFDNHTGLLHVFNNEKWVYQISVEPSLCNILQIKFDKNSIVFGSLRGTVKGYKWENKTLRRVWGPVRNRSVYFAYCPNSGRLVTRKDRDGVVLLALNTRCGGNTCEVSSPIGFNPCSFASSSNIVLGQDSSTSKLAVLKLD